MGKTQTRVFLISRFLVNPLETKIVFNSRASNDIEMKLVPVTKLDKRNIKTSKKLEDDVIS